MDNENLLPAPEERGSYTWLIVLLFLAVIIAVTVFALIGTGNKEDMSANEAIVSPSASFTAVTPAPTAIPTQEPSSTPEPAPTQQAYVKTAVFVDGSECVVLSSREAAEELLRNVENYFKATDEFPADAVTVLLNFIEYKPASESSEAIEFDKAFAYLVGRDTPLVFESRATFVQYESINHDESVIYTDDLPAGYRLVKAYGIDGKIKLTFSALYHNGKRIEFNETERVVVYPAVDGVTYIGTETHEDHSGDNYGYCGAAPLADDFNIAAPLQGSVTTFYGCFEGVFHHGIDISANAGAVVAAAADGIVVSVMERGAYGLMIEIDHGGGISTRYSMLGSVSAEVGQKVSAGRAIGTVASHLGGSYMHFELRCRGYSYDPLMYIIDIDMLDLSQQVDE